ncbi:hypothetical protein QTO34_017339 [Cnephaeus nilssonii]|uniref:Uncharacterized protein n=1 Tax=Cnephaeus nilssonii TaxID=3371016 RepID=A0AA40I1M0_CNENI|nr:hypothetical protein QTO34_017339 [Eptesicus nilssonii]
MLLQDKDAKDCQQTPSSYKGGRSYKEADATTEAGTDSSSQPSEGTKPADNLSQTSSLQNCNLETLTFVSYRPSTYLHHSTITILEAGKSKTKVPTGSVSREDEFPKMDFFSLCLLKAEGWASPLIPHARGAGQCKGAELLKEPQLLIGHGERRWWDPVGGGVEGGAQWTRERPTGARGRQTQASLEPSAASAQSFARAQRLRGRAETYSRPERRKWAAYILPPGAFPVLLGGRHRPRGPGPRPGAWPRGDWEGAPGALSPGGQLGAEDPRPPQTSIVSFLSQLSPVVRTMQRFGGRGGSLSR